MNKNITAKFESVDMAEFAAKGLKNNFHKITNIKIKYKQPKCNYSENGSGETDRFYGDDSARMVVPVSMGLSNSTPMAFPLFLNADIGADDDRELPEIERTTESRIIIKADESCAKDIAGKLRCMGGYAVEIF